MLSEAGEAWRQVLQNVVRFGRGRLEVARSGVEVAVDRQSIITKGVKECHIQRKRPAGISVFSLEALQATAHF